MGLTYFFGQLLGLICIVAGISVLMKKQLFLEIIHDIERSRVGLYSLGLLSLIAGLVIVLTDNLWHAGFFALVVTIIGWAMIIRGVFAMAASRDLLVHLVRFLKVERNFWVFGVVILVIGAYLCYAGFGL